VHCDIGGRVEQDLLHQRVAVVRSIEPDHHAVHLVAATTVLLCIAPPLLLAIIFLLVPHCDVSVPEGSRDRRLRLLFQLLVVAFAEHKLVEQRAV
jgi:hypothetical protein